MPIVHGAKALIDRNQRNRREYFALEDLHPDATDRALQRGYIAGTATIEDMLKYNKRIRIFQVCR